MLNHKFHIHDISYEDLMRGVRALFPAASYDQVKHLVMLNDEHMDAVGYIRLPLHVAMNEKLEVIDEAANALYLTIESGHAAICVMEGLENVYHTTFSAYMTRKKQGFSQVKYLKKKGKSRAGSRVRLAATTEFFEKINSTMEELVEHYQLDRIALSCSKTLLPLLYQSKIPFPLDKKDPKLYKIPLHIPQSNFTNLQETIQKLEIPTLFYEEQHTDKVSEIMEWC